MRVSLARPPLLAALAWASLLSAVWAPVVPAEAPPPAVSARRPAPALPVPAFADPPPAPPDEEVYFSPPAPGQPMTAEAAVVREIGRAEKSVLVQAYSFTSLPIARALADARARGLRVAVVVDPTDDSPRNPAVPVLAAAGVEVTVDRAHAIAHNKIVIIDDERMDGTTTISGSFNFTVAAVTRNAENLRVRRRDPLGAAYAANWRRHRKHAVPVRP